MSACPADTARIVLRAPRRPMNPGDLGLEAVVICAGRPCAVVAFGGERCHTRSGDLAWTVVERDDEARLFRHGRFIGAWHIPTAMRGQRSDGGAA